MLVRNPQDLGNQRVEVQLALGDLADATSVRNAMRGVDTVVHLAATFDDQGTPGSGGSIEEVNGLATARLLRAAEEAGAERFVFTSALGADDLSSSRFLRSKAAAEKDVIASPLATTVFAPSVIHSPDSIWARVVDGLSVKHFLTLPAATTRAMVQPVKSEQVAQALALEVANEPPEADGGARRIEIASDFGVTQFTYLSSLGHGRRCARLPGRVVDLQLRLLAPLLSSSPPPSAEDLELVTHSMHSSQGAAGMRSLGIEPTPVVGHDD